MIDTRLLSQLQQMMITDPESVWDTLLTLNTPEEVIAGLICSIDCNNNGEDKRDLHTISTLSGAQEVLQQLERTPDEEVA